MDLNKLSSYQDPEGKLNDRLAPRTNFRMDIFTEQKMRDLCTKRSVLDLGCNNGYFTRAAMKAGARRAVGVDRSDAIIGARELAKQEGVNAEFWQINLDSKEFRRFCPKFEVVFLLSVITHLNDKEEFLDWLDEHVTYTLIFESNHGEKNKAHIELIKKHIYFDSIEYLGVSDIPEKPHHLWICKKEKHDIRYPYIAELPVEFIPIDKIVGWDEETILKQHRKYALDSERFNLLKENILKRGIRDPLVVHPEENGVFKGFNGGHRYLAAKHLGYKEVPCRVLRNIYFKHLNKKPK